jgi:hypothetical protein
MKRMALGWLVIAALVAGFAPAAVAGGEGGPRCSDITDGDITPTPSTSGVTVTLTETLAAQVCGDLTYSFYVRPGGAGSTEPWVVDSEPQVQSTQLVFSVDILATEFCAYATVERVNGGGNIVRYDTAPDDPPACGSLTDPPATRWG